MNCTQTFTEYRDLLFAIAYRMLGLVMDAEDMVQETYLRWMEACDDTVETPKSYLAAIVTRLCIDHLRSAQVQREEYPGPWLPAPLITEPGRSPEGQTTLRDSLSVAFLVMLESLSAVERAVFVLREVFDYAYTDIAPIVGKSADNCRQIMRRARQHLDAQHPRFETDPAQQEAILEQFMAVTQSGSIESLLQLLAEDAVMYGDGGGQVAAAKRPIHGADQVARLLFGIVQKLLPEDARAHIRSLNGQPAVLVTDGKEVLGVTLLAINQEGRIQHVYNIVNPDKLRHLPLP